MRTWEDIERAALISPHLAAAVRLHERGMSREDALIEASLALHESLEEVTGAGDRAGEDATSATHRALAGRVPPAALSGADRHDETLRADR